MSLNLYFLSAYLTWSFCWVRVPALGRGVCVKNVRHHPLMFSERVLGHGFKLGRLCVRYLPPVPRIKVKR